MSICYFPRLQRGKLKVKERRLTVTVIIPPTTGMRVIKQCGFSTFRNHFSKSSVFNGIKTESDQQRQETHCRGAEIPSQLKTLRSAWRFAHIGIPAHTQELSFPRDIPILVTQKTAPCACLWRGFYSKILKGLAKSGLLVP